MGKPLDKKPEWDLETPTGRIEWLMRKLFDNSQTRMAKEVGITQSALANVLGGTRKPGLTMLTAIGSHPAVNLPWLITGEGQPLSAPTEPETAKDYYLPISDRLLPGPPDQNLEAGEHYPVARPLYRPQRYFCRLRAEHLDGLPAELVIRPGDMLLIEADASEWNSGMKDLRGKICIVRKFDDQGDRLVLMQIPMDADDETPGFRRLLCNDKRVMSLTDILAVAVQLVRLL
jgi:hypothetical protein